jgi:hypothetical protein
MSYSREEHAAYMRQWRRDHPLSEKQRLRDACRSYAGVYLRRGKIKKADCIVCGSTESQMHHKDYTKPLEIDWMCRSCHMSIH